MNTLLCGLNYGEEGQAVLATQTEHNSVLRPLMNQTVKEASCNNHFLPGKRGSYRTGSGKRFEEALENNWKNPSAMIINHCSNVTGYVQDMKMAADFAEKQPAFNCRHIPECRLYSGGCRQLEGRWGYFYRA